MVFEFMWLPKRHSNKGLEQPYLPCFSGWWSMCSGRVLDRAPKTAL